VFANWSRASRATRVPVGTAGVRSRPRWAALLVLLGLLLTAGCGMDVQTTKPYTPAEGVNTEVTTGNYANAVHVRNLLIISKTKGTGILSGSLVCGGSDALTGVSGKAIKTDGSDGAAITASMTTVPLANGTLKVLTNGPLITVSSPDLAPGLDAVVTLQFKNAGATTLRVPVVSGDQPQYTSITPSPVTSATPSPVTSAKPSPTSSS
jgi:hypothetical protein